MNFATLSKNDISIDIFHEEDAVLDYFIDNIVQITPNAHPFTSSDLPSAIDLFSQPADVLDMYRDLYINHNARFCFMSIEEGYHVCVCLYPMDLSEDEVREEYKKPDLVFWGYYVETIFDCLNFAYDVINSLEIEEDFRQNEQVNYTYDGDYRYC